MSGFGPIVGVDGFPLSLNGQSPVHVAPLDGLSAPALASLRAAWWTRQELATYTGVIYDATHFYDQSGASKTLTSAASISTADEGSDVALAFDPLVPNKFTRADALGLAADPNLTIAWKMRCTNLASSPGLLGLGPTLITDSCLNLYLSPGDYLVAATAAQAFYAIWTLTPGTLAGWHTYVLIKPSAGYSAAWTLSIDGAAAVAADIVSAGPLDLTADTPDFVLGDYHATSAPFGGHLAGMLVFESVLTGADLALVQAL